jgi:hypothetical protein
MKTSQYYIMQGGGNCSSLKLSQQVSEAVLASSGCRGGLRSMNSVADKVTRHVTVGLSKDGQAAKCTPH